MKCISSPLLLARGDRGPISYLEPRKEETFLANYFPVFSSSRARPSVGSYISLSVRLRAARATIIAIGFAPISVASPT